MSEDRTPPQRVRLTGLQEVQLPALVALDHACAAMYYDLGFDGAEVPTRSTADITGLTHHHNVKVAEADHQVAGYLAWRDEAPGVAYIEELSVHPDFHRFGIGSRLLEGLRSEARGFRIEEIVVKCWVKASWASSFYKARGFKAIDESAPPKVRHWLAERSAGHPFTRPGEIVMWAPVGAAPVEEEEPDELDPETTDGSLE
jgi:N-acetylglutamate synthase-like GNAT family acetyltransferase